MSSHQQAQLDSLGALSSVLDLANRLAGGKSALTGMFALELSLESGFTREDARAAFYVGLLRHLGCTAYSARESRLGNDVVLRGAMLRGDLLSSAHVVASVQAANDTWSGKLAGLSRLLVSGREMRAAWYVEACGAARLLAAGLGFDHQVLLGLDEVYERWDGTGGPAGIGGLALDQAGRMALAAHVAVTFYLDGGVPLAREALKANAGRAVEPAAAYRAIELLPTLDELSPDRIRTAEDVLLEVPLPFDARVTAQTFGDFADLQSPYTRGHSRKVADWCRRIGVAQGWNEQSLGELVQAAHLHDLGQVTLPTGLWLSPAFDEGQRKLARAHSHATEAILAGAPLFAHAAPTVGDHHERLDGSGYPRGKEGASLSLSSRILAVADVWVALQEDRPHRRAFEPAAARQLLRREGEDGRLARELVAFVLSADEPPKTHTLPLTAREIDVLRLLARGSTNKEIAARLGLSARTVQHHTIHIYQKLEVSSRAGATLIAARAGIT